MIIERNNTNVYGITDGTTNVVFIEKDDEFDCRQYCPRTLDQFNNVNPVHGHIL